MSSWSWGSPPVQSRENGQVNLFATSREKRLIPTAEWLSARYLLTSLNNDIIEQCYNEIIKSFENKQEIIYMLIKSSTSDQLKRIIEILKNAQLKSIEDDNDTASNINTDTKSCFDVLPTESIYNICEFLNKSDMISFKMVSISLALIIFDMMKCYKIGVLNMNEFIEKNEYKYKSNIDILNEIKLKRVKPFTKYKSLIDIYCKTYNISFENMLVLRTNDQILPIIKNNSNSSFGWNSSTSFSKGRILKTPVEFDTKIEKNKALYIFDKKKMILLDNNQKPTILSQITDNQHRNNYDLVLLQYFDRDSQRIQNAQFLLLDKTTTSQRIHQYICNDFHSFIKNIYKHQSLSWCDNLSCTLFKIKAFGSKSKPQLINIYENKSNTNNTTTYTKYTPKTEQKHGLTATVDDYFGGEENCEVLEEDDIVYSAMLNHSKHDTFYKLQVLKDKVSSKYYIWGRTGRVGYDGNTEIHFSENKQECIDLFKNKFFIQTGNHWEHRNNFKKKDGYFVYLIMDYSSKACYGDFRVITFEINHNHPGDALFELENKDKALLKPFYLNLQQFTEDNAGKYDLLIRNDNLDFNVPMKYFDPENDTNWKNTNIVMDVSPLTTFKMIQNRISLRFNNKIPPNNIQIYKDNYDNIHNVTGWINKKQILFGNKTIGSLDNNKRLNWMIVPYDTLSGDDMSMHHICIYQQTTTDEQQEDQQQSIKNNEISTGWNWSDNYNNQQELSSNTIEIGWNWSDNYNQQKPLNWNDTQLDDQNNTRLSVEDVKQLLIVRGEQNQNVLSGKIDAMIQRLKINYTVELDRSFEDLTEEQLVAELRLRGLDDSNARKEAYIDRLRKANTNNNAAKIGWKYTSNQPPQIFPVNDDTEIEQSSSRWFTDTDNQSQDTTIRYSELFGFPINATLDFFMRYEYQEKTESIKQSQSKPDTNDCYEGDNDNNDNKSSLESSGFVWGNNNSPSFSTYTNSVNNDDNAWSVHVAPTKRIGKTTENRMGSRGYVFQPHSDRNNRNNNKKFYYQNISVMNYHATGCFANKSLDELRFEDQYQQIAATGNDAEINQYKHNNNNSNHSGFSWGSNADNNTTNNSTWSWTSNNNNNNNNNNSSHNGFSWGSHGGDNAANNSQWPVGLNNNSNNSGFSWGSNVGDNATNNSEWSFTSNNNNNSNNDGWSWSINNNRNDNNDNNNNINNTGWPFGSFNNKPSKKIKINDFMENMINILSHPMYNDKYKSIINKYKDKDKYSFIIMNENNNNIAFTCYDNNDEFPHFVSESGFYDTNILIVENMKNVLNESDDSFPVILRFCKTTNTFGSIDKIGYPKKIWITKQTSVQQIIDEFVNDTINQFEFYQCQTKSYYLSLNDNIYEKTNGEHEILIRLKKKKPETNLQNKELFASNTDNNKNSSKNCFIWNFNAENDENDNNKRYMD